MEERGRARQRLRRRVGALGCGCFLVLTVVGLWFAWVVYRGTQNLAADFADPEARVRKVLAQLGAERLPDGYHAAMSVDVALPFKMVILSDEPWLLPVPGEDGAENESDAQAPLPIFNGVPGTKLFYYIHIEAADRTGRDPFEREFSSSEKIKQGDLKLNGRLVAWEAHFGGLKRPSGLSSGLFTRLRFECGDEETRRAVWFHEKTSLPKDLTGTPADPDALNEFLSHFRLCDVAVKVEETQNPPDTEEAKTESSP